MALTKVTYSMIDGCAINVEDYGASPSATAAANTIAIQAAFADALATGNAIQFQEGTYNHNGLVYEGSNFKIAGKNTVLNYAGDSTIGTNDAFLIRSANNTNASGLSIQGIRFQNGYSALKIVGQGAGIYSEINITDCEFVGSYSGMVWFEHCSDTIFDSNYLENGGDNGVYYSFSRNAVISNNVLRNCGGSGSITIGYKDTVITKAEGIVVIGNTIYADAAAPAPTITWTYGIDAVYCERCSIIGNNMYNTADAVTGRLMKSGIGLEEHVISDVFISNNKITNVPEEGIRLGVAAGSGWILSNVTVSDNQIFDCRYGISLERTVNSVISGNKILRAQKTGITAANTCSGLTISNNTIQDVAQQTEFGSEMGVYSNAANTNVVNNNFVDSQTGGIIDSIVGFPDATYSVDANGVITLYSIGVAYATITTAGKTWFNIKTDLEVNAGWSLTLQGNCGDYYPKAVRRTGYRWDNNVQQYNVPSMLTTAEPYYYVFFELDAINSTCFGNTYKTNVSALPNNHADTVYFQSNATNARFDVSGYGARQHYAAAAPVASTWIRGDIVWNTLPSAGGTPGWMCVTGGTPGTWKAMANLAA